MICFPGSVFSEMLGAGAVEGLSACKCCGSLGVSAISAFAGLFKEADPGYDDAVSGGNGMVVALFVSPFSKSMMP